MSVVERGLLAARARLADVVSGCTLDATAAKMSNPQTVSLPESLTELSAAESLLVVPELVVLLTEELRFISGVVTVPARAEACGLLLIPIGHLVDRPGQNVLYEGTFWLVL